ncbi:ATP-binding protein [Candidatus Magnetomorum sp. HK-1]|nr:ATP-binding protein [Candidatus Magnetomorum sp. HK-1]
MFLVMENKIMTNQINYSSEPAFINREKEFKYLLHWISGKPNSILFVYGPKSSGKTTLITKFIEDHLNTKEFNIKHFNLREMLIANYSDFIQAFFETDYSRSTEDVKQKKEYNLKLFKLTKEIKKSLENKTLDPFVVMKKELFKIVKKNKRPIIIIDELQALEDIYINGQRELLKELFNFFVALTKESHLCHVLIASSDGYFMNRIYEDSKLSKTSIFFEVSYLNEKDTKKWLSNLKQESSITDYKFSNSQIETIWKYLGGSMWEISKILSELIPYAKNSRIGDAQLKNEINSLIKINSGRFNVYANLYDNKFEMFKRIYILQKKVDEFQSRDLKPLVSNGFFEIDDLLKELSNLVRLNFLTFNPTSSFYKLQSNSMFYGLKDFIESTPL